MKQRVSILYLCFLLCFLCGACGKADMKENNNVPVITTEGNEDLMENDSSCQELDILQQNEESVNEEKLYVGEYNSYDVNEPGLQIRKNNDGTYLIQIGIYRLTQLDNCVGVEIDNRIEFSTTEWGEGREITGTITVDNDIATVKLQAEWSDTWFKDICEYKYYKISDIPNIYVYDSTEEVTDDVKEDITASDNVTDDLIVNELEKLTGEYEYLSDYGVGKLIIEKNEYAYDISDYESQSSYRFLADSSNIESIENNRIYIKYPEQVFQDDTVIFCYYILEYGEDEMDVYYKQSEQTDEQLLYHATKKN